MKPQDYKPIEFRQLCVIVKTLLLREPSMDDAEWKARTGDTLAKMGFEHPTDPTMIPRAMTGVEYALRKTIGPRPVRIPPVPMGEAYQPPPDVPKESRNQKPAGWHLVQALMAKLNPGGDSASSPTSAPVASETLALTEEEVIAAFWRSATADGADRIAILRAFAEVAILRPAGWSEAAIRADAHRHLLTANGCFGCSVVDRVIDWHHVIQIQNGGSNYSRNRVPLCGLCHAAVHPWLTPQKRVITGFTRIGQCVPADFPNTDMTRKRA